MVERVVNSISARYDAMHEYGGPSELRKLEKLECTVTKVGNKAIKGLYVTGFQGYAPAKKVIDLPKDESQAATSYTINKGDQVRIRYDWDPTKGAHVNFESGQAKIAYVEKNHKDYRLYEDVLRQNNAVTHHPTWEKEGDKGIDFDRMDPIHKRNDALSVISNWEARTAHVAEEPEKPKGTSKPSNPAKPTTTQKLNPQKPGSSKKPPRPNKL